jgi:hypothetical protein
MVGVGQKIESGVAVSSLLFVEGVHSDAAFYLPMFLGKYMVVVLS